MNKLTKLTTNLLLLLAGLFYGCAGVNHPHPAPADITLYQPTAAAPEQQLLLRYAPWFEVEDSQQGYNRIGAAAARPESPDAPRLFIDTSRPTIYTLVQKFTSGGNSYTNLIYRVHFPEVPGPHLTMGRNVGLLVYLTLNDRDEPLLLTSLHTCGCFLALVPTSNLERTSWPAGWPVGRQDVYGEMLPGLLALTERIPPGRLVLTIRSETHRIKGIEFREEPPEANNAAPTMPAELVPMSALDQIPFQGGTVSFFEKEGRRKGYVRESSKPLERLLMSWWAFDPRVGEDKALGPPEETGTSIYTSLKFWARQGSNIWNFPEFLNYWGWQLQPGPADPNQPQPQASR
ncbi:MAG: hypothetical protein HGA96_17805 [Desulfobulbaceae bacterium]|nr:hypothetical protein [Desulfobulbaceae bacterium]